MAATSATMVSSTYSSPKDSFPNQELFKRETALREFLLHRPKNAKMTSKLACVLGEMANCGSGEEERYAQEAMALANKAVELAPTKPFGYVALSLVHSSFDKRMTALKEAIRLSSSSSSSSSEQQYAMARIGLQVRLLMEPRNEERQRVQNVIGRASKQHPKRRELNQEETQVYEQLRAALDEQRSALISLDQIDFLAKQDYHLGVFFRKMQPSERYVPISIHHFQQVITSNNNNSRSSGGHEASSKLLPSSQEKMAQFWLSTMQSNDSSSSSSTQIIQRCPAEYVIGLYSTFAERFDNCLVEKLHYNTPTALRNVVDRVLVQSEDGSKRKRCWANKTADLGCGTGLSGIAFRDYTISMVGVDLSPEMLAKAKERGCYEKLVVGDVCSILQNEEEYDLILACDVFVYIGDLDDIFATVYAALGRKDAYFVFSTELWSNNDDRPEQNFVLHKCARFAHKQQYIQSLAQKHGFITCAMQTEPIRKNQGENVIGLLVVLTKGEVIL